MVSEEFSVVVGVEILAQLQGMSVGRACFWCCASDEKLTNTISSKFAVGKMHAY